MKLNDIDQTLNEAPVGVLKRAATKLKKHTPFAPGKRAEAEGEEITQKAANELALAFRKWAGTRKGDSDFNIKKLTVDDLMDFFSDEGFAKTAQEVIQAAAQKKQAKNKAQGEEPGAQDETEPKQTGTDYTDQANAHLDKMKAQQPKKNEINYGTFQVQSTSYEERLARMLNEDNGNPVTFSPKEVEKIILTIVSRVDKENHEGLAARVADMSGGSSGSSSSQASSGGKISDEEFEAVRSRIDDFVDDIERTIKKEELDDAVKKKLLKKIDDLKFDAFSDLM